SGTVAFWAETADGRGGIFTGPDPVHDKVVAVGDMLCGNPVTRVYDTFDLNDLGQVAFVVAFGSLMVHQTVFRADLGNPSANACDGDADGDGLLDSWETNGIDVNQDGLVDLDLPRLGAKPDHKDLFVEVDFMQDATHNDRPQDGALSDVAAAFAA